MDLNNLINKIGIKQKEENKALNTYIENSNQNKEKLEPLLSEFKEIISDKAAPRLYIDEDVDEYYNYINKKINDLEFDIRKVNLLLDNLPLYQINDIAKNNNINTKFGLFLSALINKTVKAGEKVQITTPIPVDYLFYRLENAEAYVNISEDYLGHEAKNSKIYAEEAGDSAGLNMQGCELHVNKAGDNLGRGTKNSSIYADEAGKHAGYNMVGCELHVKKANDYLGNWATNSRIYADEAEDLAGPFMQNSKLFIYELDGKLAGSCLNGKNKIYLGRESYYKHYLKYKFMGVKIY